MPGSVPLLQQSGVQSALICDAVRGRFVPADDMTRLREEAQRAAADRVGAVIVGPGPLGDPIVLAAGLADNVPQGLLGAALSLDQDGRHPSVLARDMTALDHVCGGRALLTLQPPFDDGTVEAITLCRALWHDGVVHSTGPRYPVPGAINRPQPPGPDSPRLALDLTNAADADADADADATSSGLASTLERATALVDLLVLPADDVVAGECRLHPVGPA